MEWCLMRHLVALGSQLIWLTIMWHQGSYFQCPFLIESSYILKLIYFRTSHCGTHDCGSLMYWDTCGSIVLQEWCPRRSAGSLYLNYNQVKKHANSSPEFLQDHHLESVTKSIMQGKPQYNARAVYCISGNSPFMGKLHFCPLIQGITCFSPSEFHTGKIRPLRSWGAFFCRDFGPRLRCSELSCHVSRKPQIRASIEGAHKSATNPKSTGRRSRRTSKLNKKKIWDLIRWMNYWVSVQVPFHTSK